MNMNETMISTFEMLIERLNAVETRLEEMQAVAATEQECKDVGRINTEPGIWTWICTYMKDCRAGIPLGGTKALHIWYIPTWT